MEKTNEEIATRAILFGVFKTSAETEFSMTDLRMGICKRPHLQIFEHLRQEITASTLKTNSAIAARHFGLREDYVLDVAKDYLASPNQAGKFPYDTYDRFTQTCCVQLDQRSEETGIQVGEPMKRERPAAPAHSAPVPVITNDHPRSKTYSTVEKVKAVRTYIKAEKPRAVARELGIPAVNIIRWKVKMETLLFQDGHANNIYIEKLPLHSRDKFLKDIDQALFKWVVKHIEEGQDNDEAIVKKAKSIAMVGTEEPKISPLWLKCFKAYYHIGQEEATPEGI